MGNLSDILRNAKQKGSLGIMLQEEMDKLFFMERKVDEDRKGMHGSGVISNDFCFREQVLSFIFKGTKPDFNINTRRIFMEGNYIHKKWQDLFMEAGIAVNIEKRCESKLYKLLMTPDAVIKLNNRLFIVEIKSVNSFKFQNMNEHESGEKQLQLYMHFNSIPHGFVLAEDKNNQNIKVFYKKYDYEVVKPFLERMQKVIKLLKIYEDENTLPKKKCRSEDSQRALDCQYREACFDIRRILLDV